MKLRLDLLKYLTTEDIAEEALANSDRYQAEPTFGKTGVGYLRTATPQEQEMIRSETLVQRLKERARLAGENPD